MKYLAIYEHDENNWSGYLPDVPGCVAAGDDKADTERLLKEALQLHLDGMIEDGDPIPAPHRHTLAQGASHSWIDVEIRVAMAA